MHLTKRFLLLAVTALAASFVAVPTASADTATCVFDGVAGTIDPDIQPIPNTGGEGNYSFSGSADCEYVDLTNTPNVSGDETPTEYSTGASITSSGEFENDVCSTGWAFSRWGMAPDPDPDSVGSTVVNFSDNRATDIASVRYMIRFDGGNGQLVLRDVNGPDLTSGGAGVVQILPSPGSTCTGPPGVSSFDVLGGFTATTDPAAV